MSGCLLVLDEEEVDDCENEGGFAWMLFEWECWGFGQIVIVIMWQPARPRASCGMGKTAPSTLWYPSPPLLHVNDDDDAKRTKDKTWSTAAVFDNFICSLFCTDGCSCEQEKYPAWERLQTYCCRQSRSIFRQSTDRGIGRHQFGPLLEAALILSSKGWTPNSEAAPNLTSKLLSHPNRGTDTDDDKNSRGCGPIADGNHGEANENEGDAHDENNNEENGVGVLSLSHIFLRSLRHNPWARFLILLWDNNTSPCSCPCPF